MSFLTWWGERFQTIGSYDNDDDLLVCAWAEVETCHRAIYLEQEVVHHLLFSKEFAHVLVFDDQLEAELLERQFIPLH